MTLQMYDCFPAQPNMLLTNLWFLTLSKSSAHIRCLIAQGAIHYLGYERPAGLLGQPVAKPTVDKRHLKTFDTIVRDVSHQLHIVYVKLAVGLALGINLPEQLHLVLVEVLAYLLYGPDVTENSARRLPFLTTVSLIIVRWV